MTNFMGAPGLYNYANAGISPNTIKIKNTALSMFFQRYLLQKAMSVFKWNLPDQWDDDYFLYTLYCYGYVAIINTDRFGVIPQHCSLAGYSVFYRPTHAIVTNPLLRGITSPEINKQCVLVKLQRDYGGIMDLVTFYADMMALTAQTAGVNLFNSNLSWIFTAQNKAAAASYKEMYNKITQEGEPMVVVDSKLINSDGSPAWMMFEQNVGQNYIAHQLLEDLRKWETMFDTAVGIPNANTDKRERLITDEVNANNYETRCNCSVWLETLQHCFEKANRMFGLQLHVDWVEDLKPKGGKQDGKDAAATV